MGAVCCKSCSNLNKGQSINNDIPAHNENVENAMPMTAAAAAVSSNLSTSSTQISTIQSALGKYC